MNRLPQHKRAQMAQMLAECSSMRSVSRIAGVSIMTVLKLLEDVGAACERFHDETVRGVDAWNIECDELWAYCYARSENTFRVRGAPGYAGNLWTWIVIDVETRMVLSYLVSIERDYDSALELMSDLRSRIQGPPTIATDGLGSYVTAIESVFGSEATHNIMSKKTPNGIVTAHVERHNLTTRMSVKRFTRLGNAFSKKFRNHELALAIYLFYYNFCKPHLSLGPLTTPAMAAGLAEFPMDIGEILDIGLVHH